MSVSLPELEGTEAAAALPSGRRHSRIPGIDAVRATAGFQRALLAGSIFLLGAAVVALRASNTRTEA